MKPTPHVRCPTCKKKGDWFATEFGPFCSKRCRLIDLGKWFSEENKITEPLKPSDLDNLDGTIIDDNQHPNGSSQD